MLGAIGILLGIGSFSVNVTYHLSLVDRVFMARHSKRYRRDKKYRGSILRLMRVGFKGLWLTPLILLATSEFACMVRFNQAFGSVFLNLDLASKYGTKLAICMIIVFICTLVKYLPAYFDIMDTLEKDRYND